MESYGEIKSKSSIVRLNSGNFRISLPGESILKKQSSVCRAFKIHKNDTKMDTILWDSQVENPFLSFCVGDYVGGNPREML